MCVILFVPYMVHYALVPNKGEGFYRKISLQLIKMKENKCIQRSNSLKLTIKVSKLNLNETSL